MICFEAKIKTGTRVREESQIESRKILPDFPTNATKDGDYYACILLLAVHCYQSQPTDKVLGLTKMSD